MIAQLVTPRTINWLKQSYRIRILHLFPEVCNLANESYQVLSVVTENIGAGPFSVVLQNAVWEGMTAETAVSINPHTRAIYLGKTAVDTQNATLWQPKPDWQRLKTLNFASLPTPTQFSGRIEQNFKILLSGIKRRDLAKIVRGTQGLVGLGQGLTPTGDDILMGVLFGLWAYQPNPVWLEAILDAVMGGATGQSTTTLSINFLRAAAAGEATQPWHNLVNGDQNAVEQILAMGHTSGSDSWAGFVRTAAACHSNKSPIKGF